MAPIKIDDLPPLQDLTEEQLQELFGAGRPNVRLSIEALEDRQLMAMGLVSGTVAAPALWASSASSQAATSQTVQLKTSPAAAAILAPTDPFSQVQGYYTSDQAKMSPVTKEIIAGFQSADYVSGESQAPYGLQDVLTYASSDQEQGRIAIANRVAQLGTARLGAAVDAESFATNDGYARIQNFKNGTIVWSPATGAQVMEGEIRSEYIRQTKAGNFPGYPVIPAQYRRNLFYIQDFRPRGWVLGHSETESSIVSSGYGTFTVSGAIHKWWADQGATGYGIPRSAQYVVSPVPYLSSVAQNFTDSGRVGAIVSSPLTGTHDVTGVIFGHWKDQRAGDLGTPMTDSTTLDPNGLYVNNRIVYFNNFGQGAAVTAIGDSVVGDTYSAWISIGGEKFFGRPISSAQDAGNNWRVNQFLSREGIRRAIYFRPTDDLYDSALLVDFNDGNGPRKVDFTPSAGRTGTSSTPLTADPPLDLSGLFKDSTHATDMTGLDSLDLSGLYQDSTQATANLLSASLGQSSGTLQPASAAYARLFETEAVGGNRADYIPQDPVFPLWLVSDQTSSDADIASLYGTPFNPDIGLWAGEYTPGPAIPPVLAREQLQGRLVQLDQALAQSQQELQGLLDIHTQYTAERERIDAEIQAVVDASSEETPPDLTDLQASQVQTMTWMEQNQQQIAGLQGQIDAITAEQALIGNALAETGLETEAASLSVREGLQARLAELDQTLAQGQQELQGLLDTHTQYTAERERIDAEIQALGEVTSEEMAQMLADLQASQVQILAALQQNEQGTADLQGQIDIFTAEQSLIGSQLAEASGGNDQAVVEAEPAQDEQVPTASEEQQPLAEDPTQQDQGDSAAYGSDDFQQEPDAPTDVETLDSVQLEEPVEAV